MALVALKCDSYIGDNFTIGSAKKINQYHYYDVSSSRLIIISK